MNNQPADKATRGRVWTFSQFHYEEVLCQLTKDGLAVQITDKPRDVLVCLLEAEGRAVTTDKLIETVWLGDAVTDHVLRTTVNALRKALGDEEREIIKTVHRLGYRMGVRVTCQVEEDLAPAKFILRTGDRLPGRPDWVLEKALDVRTPNTVWLTRHLKTKQTRVYKLAENGVRLRGLQREMTLSRLFSRLAPKATCFVQVADWQLDSLPYLLGTEFGGESLLIWATEQWAKTGLSRTTCLRVMADLCDAVDLAHEVGVFHNDLKPANVLVAPAAVNGSWHVKLTDFGISTLQDSRRLSEFDITGHGFDGEVSTAAAGSAMYVAPEVKPGQPPTRSADIYALGVILFQLLSGDFRKTPIPGWEKAVDDPLLRDDIAQSVELEPTLRLKSAAELATRLRTLDARREAERLRQETLRRNEELVRRDQRSRARRPYLQALFASLLLGLVSTGWFYLRAVRDRQTAEEINSFLTDDLLAELNPAVGRGASETFKQAIESVRPVIDSRFSDKPEIAGHIHQTLALALDGALDNGPAAEEYERAAADWIRVEGPLSEDALFERYRQVMLDARNFSPGTLDRARKLQNEENAVFQQVPRPWPKVRVVKLEAEGAIAKAEGKPKDSVDRYRRAVELAEMSPEIPVRVRLAAKEKLCFAEFRAEEAVKAEQCFREVVAAAKSLGERDENLVPAQLGIAQALRYQGRSADVIQQINSSYPTVVKQLGTDAEYSMVLLGMRAEAEAALGQWDAAIKDDMAVADHSRKVDPKGFPALVSLSDLAQFECRSGRTKAGEQHAHESIEAINIPGGNPGFLGAFREVLASCLIPQIGDRADPARLNEAELILNSINIALVSGSVGDATWGANVDLDRAEIAFHRGEYATAGKYLDSARPAFMPPQADAYQRKEVNALAIALIAQISDSKAVDISHRTSRR